MGKAMVLWIGPLMHLDSLSRHKSLIKLKKWDGQGNGVVDRAINVLGQPVKAKSVAPYFSLALSREKVSAVSREQVSVSRTGLCVLRAGLSGLWEGSLQRQGSLACQGSLAKV